MRRVFADAWFYIALLDPHDAGHDKALAVCADVGVSEFVTTRWVLMEVANMLAGTKARRQCAAFFAGTGRGAGHADHPWHRGAVSTRPGSL